MDSGGQSANLAAGTDREHPVASGTADERPLVDRGSIQNFPPGAIAPEERDEAPADLETGASSQTPGASRLAASTERLANILHSHLPDPEARFDSLVRRGGASSPARMDSGGQSANLAAMLRSHVPDPEVRSGLIHDDADAPPSSRTEGVDRGVQTESGYPDGRIDLEEIMERLAEELEDGIARTYGSSGG
jgi:hypothetical protein